MTSTCPTCGKKIMKWERVCEDCFKKEETRFCTKCMKPLQKDEYAICDSCLSGKITVDEFEDGGRDCYGLSENNIVKARHDAKIIARDLDYSDYYVRKIRKAETTAEIYRILHSARTNRASKTKDHDILMLDNHRISSISATSFGERLQAIRQESGYTRLMLAEIAGVSAYTIRNYELNLCQCPKTSNVKSLAKALKVSYNWLFLGKK